MNTAVQLVQSMLNGSGAIVREDGVWGKSTDSAYLAASPEVRGAIDDAVGRWEGTSVEELRRRSSRTISSNTAGGASISYRRQPSVKESTGRKNSVIAIGKTNFISRDAAVGLARKYNNAASLPTGTMEHMLDLEALKVPGGFNPSGIGGAGNRYRGLYQFHDNAQAAWADGVRWARTFGVQVASMYPDGWADAESNTACAAGYATMNAKLLRDSNIRVTKETLYACHQQGAGAFKNMVRSRNFAFAGAQSSPSVNVLKTAYKQATA